VPWSGFAPCQAVLFDLDDTLIDFGGSVEQCWQAACVEAAALAPEVSADALRQAIGHTADWYWADPERHRVGRADLLAATNKIVAEALRSIGRPNDDLARAVARRYRALRDDSLTLFPGAVELLAALAAAGYSLGLITNGEAALQRAKLERFRLGEHFAYVGIEGETGFGKPAAEAYRVALETLTCAPRDAWMIGDNLEWDVLAPQRLGLRTIWIDRGLQGLPPDSLAKPDHIARGVNEVFGGVSWVAEGRRAEPATPR
jgi:putative hydrolase of the HAD superfamily